MIDRRKYDELLQKEFIRLLNERLPQELILTVGRDNLITASRSVLPVLETLNGLSQRYADALEILKRYDEARILREWNEIEADRIEPSKKMLTIEWYRRRDDSVITAVVNLLEDWRSQTPFDDVLKVFPCCATRTLSVGNKIPCRQGCSILP
jgi:hypothetical protein